MCRLPPRPTALAVMQFNHEKLGHGWWTWLLMQILCQLQKRPERKKRKPSSASGHGYEGVAVATKLNEKQN